MDTMSFGGEEVEVEEEEEEEAEDASYASDGGNGGDAFINQSSGFSLSSNEIMPTPPTASSSSKKKRKDVLDLSEFKSPLNLSKEQLESLFQKDTVFFSPLSKSISDSMFYFDLPNRVGRFRVTVLGISAAGHYGTFTSSIQIQKPFSAFVESPNFMRNGDVLQLELVLQNNSK